MWRAYEELICAQLRRRAEGAARIEFDQRVVGRLSGHTRQVDITVVGRFPGLVRDTATMAVDCKLWSRKVAIDDVDRFVGFLADAGPTSACSSRTSASARRPVREPRESAESRSTSSAPR
jgi:hypothetical protein